MPARTREQQQLFQPPIINGPGRPDAALETVQAFILYARSFIRFAFSSTGSLLLQLHRHIRLYIRVISNRKHHYQDEIICHSIACLRGHSPCSKQQQRHSQHNLHHHHRLHRFMHGHRHQFNQYSHHHQQCVQHLRRRPATIDFQRGLDHIHHRVQQCVPHWFNADPRHLYRHGTLSVLRLNRSTATIFMDSSGFYNNRCSMCL